MNIEGAHVLCVVLVVAWLLLLARAAYEEIEEAKRRKERMEKPNHDEFGGNDVYSLFLRNVASGAIPPSMVADVGKHIVTDNEEGNE